MKKLNDIKETLVEWFKKYKVLLSKINNKALLSDTVNMDLSFAIDYSDEEVSSFNKLKNEYLGCVDGMGDFGYLSYAQILSDCLEIQNLIHFNLVNNTDRNMVKFLEDDYAIIHNLMVKTIKYFTAK